MVARIRPEKPVHGLSAPGDRRSAPILGAVTGAGISQFFRGGDRIDCASSPDERLQLPRAWQEE